MCVAMRMNVRMTVPVRMTVMHDMLDTTGHLMHIDPKIMRSLNGVLVSNWQGNPQNCSDEKKTRKTSGKAYSKYTLSRSRPTPSG